MEKEMSVAIEGDFRLHSKEGQQLQEVLLKRKSARDKQKEIYKSSKLKKSSDPDDAPAHRYLVQRALTNDQYTTADDAVDVVTEALLACKSKYRRDLGLAPTMYQVNPGIITEVERAKLRSRQFRLYKSMMAGKFTDHNKQTGHIKEWYSRIFSMYATQSLTNSLS